MGKYLHTAALALGVAANSNGKAGGALDISICGYCAGPVEDEEHARHGAAKRRTVARALGYWAAALAAWLAVAFRLEFAGDAAHGPLWALGLGFLAANAGLLAAVLDAGGVS